MKKREQITQRQARLIGNCLYLDWEKVDLEEFRQGLMGYHRKAGADSLSSSPEVVLAGRSVLAHIKQFPDYFVRVARLRAEARATSAAKKPALPLQST